MNAAAEILLKQLKSMQDACSQLQNDISSKQNEIHVLVARQIELEKSINEVNIAIDVLSKPSQEKANASKNKKVK